MTKPTPRVRTTRTIGDILAVVCVVMLLVAALGDWIPANIQLLFAFSNGSAKGFAGGRLLDFALAVGVGVLLLVRRSKPNPLIGILVGVGGVVSGIGFAAVTKTYTQGGTGFLQLHPTISGYCAIAVIPAAVVTGVVLLVEDARLSAKPNAALGTHRTAQTPSPTAPSTQTAVAGPIARSAAIVYCEHCGARFTTPEARFCGSCGKDAAPAAR